MSDVRDLRDVLEAVTFGEDDRIRPADRVRSAELLRELNALGLDDLFRLETASMSGEELDAAFDASTAVLLRLSSLRTSKTDTRSRRGAAAANAST